MQGVFLNVLIKLLPQVRYFELSGNEGQIIENYDFEFKITGNSK